MKVRIEATDLDDALNTLGYAMKQLMRSNSAECYALLEKVEERLRELRNVLNSDEEQ